MVKADKKGAEQVAYGLLILGLLGVGGYAFWYFVIRKDQVQADLDKLKSSGVVPTFTDSQAQGFADALDNLLDAYFIKDSDVMDIWARCVNLADVLLIISKYGTHFHFAVNYIGNYTLPEFMNLKLSKSTINEINSGFQLRSINYRF